MDVPRYPCNEPASASSALAPATFPPTPLAAVAPTPRPATTIPTPALP